MKALRGYHCQLMSKHVDAERLMPEDSGSGRATQEDDSAPPHRRNSRIVHLRKAKRVAGSRISKALDGHLRVQENESLTCSDSLLWTAALLQPCAHAVP